MFKDHHPNYFHTSSGVRIFYSTNFNISSKKQHKPVLVFNYGLVCNNNHWQYQYEYFDKLNYNILLHDYRCHFNSSGKQSVSSCTFSNITQDIYELVTHLNLKKIILLGHSMGVNLSLEYAKKHPARVMAMILISGTIESPREVMFDSNIIDVTLPYIEWLVSNYPNIFNVVWKTGFLNPLFSRAVHTTGFNPKQVSKDFVEIYLKKISELPYSVFFKLFKEMHNHNFIKNLEDIEKPTLIIGGDNDKIIPNYLQFDLHKKIKNSEFYRIKDGSHVPQVDFPDMINERILEFISGINYEY